MLQIEDHNMTIIASEISYVQPFTIDSLFSVNGERFDFVLAADKPPKDYWIRVKTMLPCRTQIETFAILRYGSEFRMAADIKVAFTANLPPRLSNESFPEKKVFNSPMPKVKDIPILRLDAYESDKSLLNTTPDKKVFLFLDSPTILDDTMSKDGNYYKLSCEFSARVIEVKIQFCEFLSSRNVEDGLQQHRDLQQHQSKVSDVPSSDAARRHRRFDVL